jgi:hypothetical protein
MKPDAARKFSISDGLLLIVGIAVSFGLVRASLRDFRLDVLTDLLYPRNGWSVLHYFGVLMELTLIFGIPALVAWTPFCLLTQVIKPRARWRTLRRQPGFVANLVASVVAGLTVAIVAICVAFSAWEGSVWFVNRFASAYVLGGFLAGSGVLWSWLAMWICGTFRSTTAWKDRLGRVNGAAWIVVGMICAFFISMKLD